MPHVLRTAFLAVLGSTLCCAFQNSLPVQSTSALRGLRLVHHRTAAPGNDDLSPQESKQIFIVPTTQLRAATSAAMPITFDEGAFETEQEFQILPDTQVALESSALAPAAPTRGMALMAALLGALSLAQHIPHSVLAHIAGGCLGGILALCVTRAGDEMVNGRLSEKMAAHGMVKGTMAGCYNSLVMSLESASLVSGMAGVAVASAGTGLVIGMMCKAIERANAIGDAGVPFLTRIQTKASHGLFTEDGLFGASRGLASDLTTCVVQYQAFYLACSVLGMAFPWMGITFTGSALTGAIAGVTSLAAGACFQCLTNLSEFSSKCKEWWFGSARKRDSAAQTVDMYSRTALTTGTLFLGYKAAYDMVMMAVI